MQEYQKAMVSISGCQIQQLLMSRSSCVFDHGCHLPLPELWRRDYQPREKPVETVRKCREPSRCIADASRTEEGLRAQEARRERRLDEVAARTEEEITTEEEKKIQRLKDLGVDKDRPPRRFLFSTFITADVPISVSFANPPRNEVRILSNQAVNSFLQGQAYHAIPQSVDLAGFAVMRSEERPSIHDEGLVGEIPKTFLGKLAEEIVRPCRRRGAKLQCGVHLRHHGCADEGRWYGSHLRRQRGFPYR